MDKQEKRERLFAVIRDRSFSQGAVKKLSSGKESNFYFDMKMTMLHPDAVDLLSELICDRIEAIKPDYVGGLELGAVPLIAPVISSANKRGLRTFGFLVRKRPKDHGTKKVLEGVEDLAGKTVVVLEDVTTTGGSAMDAVRAVQDAGGRVALVLSIVDRCEGAVEFYAEQKLPFASLFSADDFRSEPAVAASA